MPFDKARRRAFSLAGDHRDLRSLRAVPYAIAGAALVLLAVVASHIPTRRATGRDPIVALRAE